MEEEKHLPTKVLIFVFGFMFLYIAINFLGATVELAVIISIIILLLIYGFTELNWYRHVKKLFKKEEEKTDDN